MTHTTNTTPPDEIDLRELFLTLWRAKTLILTTTLIVTCMAAGYAFFSPPVYQTSVQILPPTANGLAGYNIASQLTGGAISSAMGRDAASTTGPGIPGITPEDAYTIFLRHLNSNTVRQQFLETHYLPAPKEHPAKSLQQARKQLDSELTISLPKRAGDVQASITLEGTDPQTIATLANTYMDLAAQAAREDLLAGLAGEVAIRQRSLEIQMATARQIAEKVRQDRIVRLQEALAVAEGIGLDSPTDGTPLIAINTQNLNTESVNSGSLLYLRGTKALRSEIQQLHQQRNDDAYIAELPNLKTQKALLDSIDLNPELLSVATIDREAIVPAEPTKPKKALIIALGIVLGGMLGIFAALLRNLFRH